uniref:BED-type domain-containing protein n=1 Tax=Paramormyrops kingsleyae TaxID=1676925 RepID=A0A3B3QXA7_9TELE
QPADKVPQAGLKATAEPKPEDPQTTPGGPKASQGAGRAEPNPDAFVQCVLCAGDKRLSTAKSSTSNLSKHLKGQHSAVRLVEKAGSVPDTDSDSSFPATKQLRLDFSSQLVSAENLKKLVAAYIVEEMLPISTVDSPSFRGLIDKIPTRNNARLPQRKTFSNYLDKEYATMEANLRAALQAVNFVSTTADIWTSHNKSYMGVTIHWFNPCTLQRNKAAPACKRIRGRHTYDVIAGHKQIHSSYGVLNKVVTTVTDNGSNFVKAFKTYQHVSESDDDEEEAEEGITFTDITEALSTVNEDNQQTLPPHYCCASHTLNLVSTSDVEKFLTENTNTRAVYRVKHVEEVSQRKLLVPSSTRWNSFFEAVSRITEIPMNDLNTLCNKLGVKCFNEKENQFLMEYCTAMKPLTAALDILQGDNCSYGALIPTLEVLMTKTLSTKDTFSRMKAGLPDVIVKVCPIDFLFASGTSARREIFSLPCEFRAFIPCLSVPLPACFSDLCSVFSRPLILRKALLLPTPAYSPWIPTPIA